MSCFKSVHSVTFKAMDEISRTELKKFIELYGTYAKAAAAIGVTESAIGHYVNGRRRITADLALKIHELTSGEVDKGRLLFGEAA